MAAIGIYGVVAYTVAQRTREIGVRRALGARGASIVGLVVGEGLRRTVAGIVVGMAGTLAAAGAVRSLLFGVGATDPATYGGVVGLLLAVTVLACLLPAWRATRVDPQVALRGD
jgi:ABC-type antimicrobial peptide transport system permease subunit